MDSELTANIVASASVLAATTLASKLLLNYVFLSDNTPVSVQQKDDKDIEIKPPPVTDNNPSGAKPSVPVVKEQIVLPSGLDLTTYRTQDLKPERSFIRAFYYIRFQKDPTDKELESFVETDIIQRFLKYPIDNMNRVFYVMHFACMYEKAPYINFFKIRNAGLKSLDKNMKVTIEDLLKAAEASDTLIRYLKTTRDNIGVLSNFIKEKILEKNAGFFAQTTDKQLALIQQYGSNNSIVLELFNSLSTLISEKGLYNILEECLKDECKNLEVNETHKTNDRNYRKFIESLKSNNTIPEVNFPFRCGVGDMLANAKTKEQVCVTYIKAETKEHHNYGCDNRNSVDPTRYIIYEYKNHHCVLLTPKTVAPSSKVAESKPSNPVVPSSNNTSKTVPAEVQNKPAEEVQNNNSPNVSVAPATEEPCKKYEDAYFSQGGRKKKQKRVTKRRRRSKSGRKGTKRI